MTLNDNDLHLLRLALDVARRVRKHGNHPFGAVLAAIPSLHACMRVDLGQVNKSQST